jgi:hypothetical protein
MASNAASISAESISSSGEVGALDLLLKAATRPMTLVPFRAMVNRSREVDLAGLTGSNASGLSGTFVVFDSSLFFVRGRSTDFRLGSLSPLLPMSVSNTEMLDLLFGTTTDLGRIDFDSTGV